jgi:inner membrane protein
VASLFAHAALPLLASRALALPKSHERRALLAGVLCGCLPDLDVVTYALEIRANEPLGHRGLFHSLLASIVLAAVATWFVGRGLDRRGPEHRRVFFFLLFSAASHGVLDALTQGEVGVALFAPFSPVRVASPWKLLPACPVGLTEYLGYFGLLTLANEVLYAAAPVALAVSLVRSRRPELAETEPTPRRVLLASAAWLAVAVGLRVAMPETFAPTVPRVLEPVGTADAGRLEDLPRDGLPENKLVTRLPELERLGLFGRRLEPRAEPWSSTFFPSWYGGEAGRWTEGSVRLGTRTLTGFDPPTEAEARAWLTKAAEGDAAAEARLFTLAPTEKVDIAFGKLDFPATRQGLGHSHNGHPRYWSGRCNGVATASLVVPEPFRVVEVVGPSGQKVRFHPNDVKSLLSVAYYTAQDERIVGDFCREVAFDSGRTCSMSPAVLVIALANRIGLARESFLIDALPTIAKQYYAVAAATITLTGTPRAPGTTPRAPALDGKVDRLVDVRIDLVVSSTTLSYAKVNVPDRSAPDGSRYTRVGVVPVPMSYTAELALDRDGELVGGRWTGDPADGPDAIFMGLGGPKLEPDGRLSAATEIPWGFVRALAEKSVEEGPTTPRLDLATCATCR